MNQLTESGNTPLLTLIGNGNAISSSTLVNLEFEIENLGNQSAIEPVVLLFKAKNYKEVVEGDLDKSILNYELNPIKSLRPGEKTKISFEMDISVEERKSRIVNGVIEIVYKTIYGDLISDISELIIYVNVMMDLKLVIKLSENVINSFQVCIFR